MYTSLQKGHFSYEILNRLLEDSAETGELIALLSIQFPIPTEYNKTHISRQDIIFFSDLLKSYSEVDVWSKEIENCILAVFQALRNSMAYNQAGQNLILAHESILFNISGLFCNRIAMSKALIQMCLKFLTNLVIRNKNSASTVCKHFESTILNLLSDRICMEMTVTLYYNILLLQPPNVRIDLDILHRICFIHTLNEFEMTTFCLQNLLLKQNLMMLYDSIQKRYSLIILRILQDALDMKINLTITQVKFVADMFKTRWQYLVSFYTNSGNKTSDIQAFEVVHLVDILAALTSNDIDLIVLQEDRKLFVETFFLLKSVHETGKMYQNVFTPINKLRDTECASSMQGLQELQGFKSALIRIIGNLCHNHKSNQDEIRELNGIGLILDCCNIDSRNPFLMQWAIYSLRNICKENLENQKHISSMKMQGSYSRTLTEMGISLCKE